jgi:hypothetical protein
MLTSRPSWNVLSVSARGLILSVAIAALLAFGGLSSLAQESGTAARGWFLSGDHPQNYSIGVDHESTLQGRASGYLKAKPTANEGFGTMMQMFNAMQYAGQRVRFSAYVKTEGLNDWAGLWMRVDKQSQVLAFDNMNSRPIKGTNDWRNYEVVLDVPKDATAIAFGVLLQKAGTVWVSSVRFESVGAEVPTTGTPMGPNLPDHPTNLSFEESEFRN